jgi:ATP-dependent helicase/DNAse subunit B
LKTLLSTLGGLSSNYLLQEKVLVVPSFSVGRQIIKAMTLEGIPSLNLRVETVRSLALKLCRPLLNQREIVSDTVAVHLVAGILQQLSAHGKLSYFGALGITPGLSGAMYNAIKELRLAGLTAADLQASTFIRADKGRDVITILEEYLITLNKLGYIDEAELYLLARKQTTVDTATVYIIPENLDVKPVQRTFLEALTSKQFETISFNPVKGLRYPQERFVVRDNGPDSVTPASPNGALGYLYDLVNATNIKVDFGIEMFSAYGETNEVREVIRRIKTGDYPFDQVTIIYTTREPYAQLFYDLSQKLSLPLSFGEGIAINNTRPGKLIAALVEWIKSNYNVAVLYAILTSDYFSVDDENAPSILLVANLLRSAGIGWGRARYLRILAETARGFAGDAKDPNGEKRSQLTWTSNFVEGLFSLIPEAESENRVSYERLISGIAQLILKYAPVKDPFDAEAKQSISETLQTLAVVAVNDTTMYEALTGILRSVQGLRVGKSGPKPGCIHICGYRSGVYAARPYNFVVGLDAARFPGQVKEDPILLDVEKEKLGLALAKEQPKENLYGIVQLLASLTGKITLSFPGFNTVENRSGFPSALLLQVYRLLTGDNAKDYSDLLIYLGNMKGFVPDAGDAMDDTEFWLERTFKGDGVKDALPTAVNVYTGLKAGLEAQASRLNTVFSEFDGKIPVERISIDPRQNPSIIMSCSQLENLAKCPFRYFLRYLLRVEPPLETSFDPGVWLEPKDRGSLLHEIFECFYLELPTGEKPNLERHEQLLYHLAEGLLARKKEELPPPSDVVFEYERREILHSCRIFLASEENVVGTPTYFELSFGMGEKTNGLGELPEAHIRLLDGSVLRLRGRIDRVDLEQDGTFTIIDYKTGGTYLYNARQPFRNGRLLQHSLYAMALEKLLKDSDIFSSPKVTKAGYIFPSLKGEGQRVLYEQVNRQPACEILENLCEILASGSFVMTNDPKDCSYCDYTTVCEPGVFQEFVDDMLGDTGNTELEFFRRLKKI